MDQVNYQMFRDSIASTNKASKQDASVILLVLPMPVYRCLDGLHIDAQAYNGLGHWLTNFDRMILCLPERPITAAAGAVVPLEPDAFDGRCRIICLPDQRHPLGFLRELAPVVRTLDTAIDESTHRSFAIGGLFGDWGAIAALLAHRKGVVASIWADRVESQVTRFAAQQSRGPRKLLRLANAFAMKHFERMVIRRSTIGLFHGADCFAAYARFSAAPHIVHNIHLSSSARITPDALVAKAQHRRGPMRIVYAGRAHAEKGVLDWVETLRLVANRGAAFTATWFGDGPDLEVARAAVASYGMQRSVSFPGALHDRDLLMRTLREADVFLFCHKTPESPRCLIEALISGTPIVGYDSAYPRDLIHKHRGGRLTTSRPAPLAETLLALIADKPALAALTENAAADGYPFTDTEVFRHRADLIRSATAIGLKRARRARSVPAWRDTDAVLRRA